MVIVLPGLPNSMFSGTCRAGAQKHPLSNSMNIQGILRTTAVAIAMVQKYRRQARQKHLSKQAQERRK